MVPGGEPIDWAQPLMPQKSVKVTIITMEPKPSGPFRSPINARIRFTTAEIPMPAAMKRRMLQ